MPEKFIEERFNQLSESVSAAAGELAADREERGRLRKAEEDRTRWWRRLTVVAVVGSMLGLWASFEARGAADTANDTLEQFEADRVARSEVACREANKDRESVNGILTNAVAAPRPTPRTPEQRAQAEAFLAANLRPLRDCSPEGIADYFAETGGTIPVEVPPVP